MTTADDRASRPKLTKAEWRALNAVARGAAVTRIYRPDGNVLKAAAISSATLWRLDKRGLIKDAPNSGSYAPQVLTPAGRRAIQEHTP